MYYLVRILSLIAILGIIYLIVRQSQLQDKRIIYVYSAYILLILTVILSDVRVENYLFSFDSAEEAYQYKDRFGNRRKVNLVVQGEASDLVIGDKGTVLIPKTTDGWKLEDNNDVEHIGYSLTNEYIVEIYQYEDTNDYYVSIDILNEKPANVLDACDSTFIYLEESNSYYAYLSDCDEQYWLKINGSNVIFEQYADMSDGDIVVKIVIYSFLVLILLRIIIQFVILLLHNDICRKLESLELHEAKIKVHKIRRMCKIFSRGLFSKQMLFMYNNLSWVLASISFCENHVGEFLGFMDSIMRQEEFELKAFVLALYYLAENKSEEAENWFKQYKKCSCQDGTSEKILKVLFEGEEKNEAFYKAVESYKSPVIIQLFKENNIFSNNGQNNG